MHLNHATDIIKYLTVTSSNLSSLVRYLEITRLFMIKRQISLNSCFCQHSLFLGYKSTSTPCSCLLPTSSSLSPNSKLLAPEPLFLIQDYISQCRLLELPFCKNTHPFFILLFYICFPIICCQFNLAVTPVICLLVW